MTELTKGEIKIINTFKFDDEISKEKEEKVKPIVVKKKAIQEHEVNDKKKNKDTTKPLRKPYDEVYSYIFDLDTMTFKIVETDVFKSNLLLVGDFSYIIDRKLIFGPLNGYDIKRDLLSMFKIIGRMVFPKHIGVLFFIKPELMEEIPVSAIIEDMTDKEIIETNEAIRLQNEDIKKVKVRPITFDDMKQEVMMKLKRQNSKGKDEELEMEVVPCEPCLLKVIATNTLYEDMIKSYKRLEAKQFFGKWWKIMLVAIIIVVIILVVTQTGLLASIGV